MILKALKKQRRKIPLVWRQNKYSVHKWIRFCGFEFRFSRNYFWVKGMVLLDTAENLHDAQEQVSAAVGSQTQTLGKPETLNGVPSWTFCQNHPPFPSWAIRAD